MSSMFTAKMAILQSLPLLTDQAREIIESDSLADKDGTPVPGSYGGSLEEGCLVPDLLKAIRAGELVVGQGWRIGEHHVDPEVFPLWIFDVIDGVRKP